MCGVATSNKDGKEKSILSYGAQNLKTKFIMTGFD
jgi:hypothetical protein